MKSTYKIAFVLATVLCGSVLVYYLFQAEMTDSVPVIAVKESHQNPDTTRELSVAGRAVAADDFSSNQRRVSALASIAPTQPDQRKTPSDRTSKTEVSLASRDGPRDPFAIRRDGHQERRVEENQSRSPTHAHVWRRGQSRGFHVVKPVIDTSLQHHERFSQTARQPRHDEPGD